MPREPKSGRGGNGDGKLSKAEMQAMVGKRKIPEAFFKRTFDKGDLNKDGVLEGIELDKAFLSEKQLRRGQSSTRRRRRLARPVDPRRPCRGPW